MTPSQLEHLRLIDAHLKRLLDIASKRTPGEWDVENISPARHDVVKESGGKITSIFRAHDGCHEYREAALPDAIYIAACAGNAEAGWRATRAMIEFALMVIEFHSTRPKEGPQRTELETVEEVAMRILAAFPLETLNPKQP